MLNLIIYLRKTHKYISQSTSSNSPDSFIISMNYFQNNICKKSKSFPTWHINWTYGLANQSWWNTIPSGHTQVRLKPTGKKEEGWRSNGTTPAKLTRELPFTCILSRFVKSSRCSRWGYGSSSLICKPQPSSSQ